MVQQGHMQADIAFEVFKERDRQMRKWGDQHHDDPFWLVILAEEFGEVARAIFENDQENMDEELIQVMAVAMAWLEDRRANEGTG